MRQQLTSITLISQWKNVFLIVSSDLFLFPTECVTSPAPSFCLPAGDETANIFSTECVTLAAPSFQLSVGDENANIFSTDCVASTMSSFQPSVGDEDIKRFSQGKFSWGLG